ncbi:MAG: cysteine rich repeat-containing protein [Xanthobacteraceae bacterium]
MSKSNKHPWVLAPIVHLRALLSGLAAAVLLLASAPGASAQQSYRGSEAEQQACTDDVFRLCNEFVPDEQRIIACLGQNRRNRSAACRAVFSRGPEGGRPRSEDGDSRR